MKKVKKKKQKETKNESGFDFPVGEDFEENILDVDKNLLDDEWLEQPKLFNRWGDLLENTKDELRDLQVDYDILKEDMKGTLASLEISIRKEPESFGLEKVTDKSVAAFILIRPEYKKAFDELIEKQREINAAIHKVGILEVAIKSIDHRKRALENLVSLHGQKYFAIPQADENSRESMEEVVKSSVRRKNRKG